MAVVKMTTPTGGVASWRKALAAHEDTIVSQRFFWLKLFLVLRVLPGKVVYVQAGVYARTAGVTPYPSWRRTSESTEQLSYY